LNAAQDLQKKSQALFQEIQSFRDESQKLLENIRNNEIESTTLKESTHRIFEESRKTTDAKIEEIKKITALITDTGFANAFNERAKKLFWGYIVWGVILLISTSILVVELYQFFKAFGGDNIPEIKVIIFRLSLTSPLLFLIGFSISQYRFDRLLNEKYNFKAVTASVVREHIEFLLSRFDAKDGAWELTREIFEMIYEEPYEKHEYGYRKIKEIEKEISDFKKEKEVDIKKIIDSAKELKGLFSDENLLKRVIEFFSKFF